MTATVGSDGRVVRDASDPARLMALAIYGETGSLSTASRETGIPISTISTWLDQEGTADTIESLRNAIRAETAHRWAAIATHAINVAMDRVQHGDYVLDKRGVMHRVPIKARDAALIASIATDKHCLISGALANGAKIDKALASIASQLVTLAQATQGATHGAQAPTPLAGGAGIVG